MSIERIFKERGNQHHSGTDSGFALGGMTQVWRVDQGGVEIFSVMDIPEDMDGR